MQSFAHFTPTPQKIVAQKPKTISSKEEFEVIKTHCMQGANMLRRLENFEDEPLLQTAYDIARWHHERWDGRGYPDGLKGNDIPISAQIVSLADVYDALTKTLVLLVAGAVLIAVGANLLVDNGTLIAQALGVPESVIALTFVALGTSLPELVTAITSLVKGCSDLSLGNIVGANVFNLVLVSGASVTIAPFTIPQSATLFGINSSLVLDLPVMLAVMVLMCVPALVRGKLSRVQGVLLLCIYAAFCAIQFTM